jgi:hypothetical protein
MYSEKKLNSDGLFLGKSMRNMDFEKHMDKKKEREK